MTKLKVYISKSNEAYEDMFINRGWELCEHPVNADLIQFTGGPDVCPNLYGSTFSHPLTYAKPLRDWLDLTTYCRAKLNNKPMAGICRGGQFLNVMSGGSLVQHVDHHKRPHILYDITRHTTLEVSSTHHQMMVEGPGSELIAHAGMLSSMPDTGFVPNSPDPEVVYYSAFRSLCFQPHPEYAKNDCQDYYFDLINSYLVTCH